MAESVESSISAILLEWDNLFRANALTKGHIRAFWKDEVPLVFSPRPQSLYTSSLFDENATQPILLEVLEYFMFGKRLPEMLDDVKRDENPPMLCGKVFKNGEPTYSCRDCGMDPTCVLCVDCFKASAHRSHRYKMSASGGGGYCDCGDKEAWKIAPFCETHKKGVPPEEEVSCPLGRLPDDVVVKCRIVFETVLDYCYQMLIWEKPISLPEDLKPEEMDCTDTFATMLFNDEVHTYEQVIRTLQRAIECSHKEAIDYATVVDREGRSIVKCANFNNCSQVKGTVERMTSHHNPKPLRVSVMHTAVIAHQNFALRLMQWMQQLINNCQAFRLLFSEAITRPRPNEYTILEGIMEYDTQLWKTARTQWHQLFISGMMMEPSSKRTFSKLFARNYPSLMKDFIADDHDHSLSITSLSVQIFTVPTLAHMLIMEDDVLTILLRTFNSECETKLNGEGKLFFERNQTVSTFRRAQYILFDLKYLLSYKPEWKTPMRRNFLHGLGKLLDLLSLMQGMDITVRQVGQHMEFEPEWESAFNLYIRLIPVINLVLEWCGTDRVVLIKAYRAALKKQATLYGHPVSIVHEVADHAVACISYDVSSQQVSIHLPLSRLIAGLHLHLDKYDLSFDSPEFLIPDKPTPVFLLELPLRTQVMIAQVHAGMWRRNGYSLVNQIYFYQNVRCRAEMYDRDIVLLQIGASLVEGNEFLIHLLNKFGLMNWVKADYESDFPKNEDDSVRQIVVLVEEFLELLIVIVAERFTPGVGQVSEEDKVQKEIIQQLCIEPMAHSQLSKALPEDSNHETGLETVINQVATFRKPQGTARGIYELKPEFYKEYNPYFYHYGREEQSKAEEAQRKRKKQMDEEDCSPPPIPPSLCRSFGMLVNVLQCDVMLHIITIILERFANLRARTFSEMQLQKLLHLIGYALHEEQRSLQSGTQDFFQFTQRAEKANMFNLLSALAGHQRIESNKELLNWVLRKFRLVQQLHASAMLPSEGLKEAIPMEISNPTQDAESMNVGVLKEEKRKRAEIAAARRTRILAQMSAMQKNFIREHADLFENTQVESGLSGSAMDLTEVVADEMPVCLGPNQTSWKPIPNRHTCILCQEDQDVTANGRAMVYSALVQKSMVLSKNRDRVLEKPEEYDPLFAPIDLFCAPHTSTCGHVMHADCWQKYLESVLAKERRRAIRIRHPLSFDLDKQEFLCPLCECLSNTVIPIVPALKTLLPDTVEEKVTVCMDEWLAIIQVALDNGHPIDDAVNSNSGGTDQMQSPETSALKQVIKPPTTQEMFSQLDSELILKLSHLYPDLVQLEQESGSQSQFSSSVIEMLNLFGQATYTIGLGVELHPENKRVPLMAWYSCAYTIHAIENLLRSLGKPLFGELSSRQSDCLNVLVRFASVCAQVSHPSIIHTHCHRLLTSLMHRNQEKLNLLDVDAFGLLVTLVFSLPYLISRRTNVASCSIPQGLSQELSALKLIYVLHILQILLTTDFSKVEFMSVEEEAGENEGCLLEVYNQVTELLRIFPSSSFTPNANSLSPHLIQREVQRRSVPFLRCCALFFHCLTGVPAPQMLCEISTNEYGFLCQYLGLATDLSSLFESKRMKALVNNWLMDPRLDATASQGTAQFPLTVNQLWKLPSDYSELINEASMFTCPNFDGEDSRTPTMCLVCGKMLCSQSYCCQTELGETLVGACTNHAHFCGAGVGIFLRVRECKVLLLAGRTKGCFVPPPYLDQYGETDQGLRRGNPLHLCEENYRKLHKLWLSHGIPEEIAHSLESNAHIISIDWQHL